MFRAAGVLLCTVKTNLTWKERLFCVIAYLPKATVQAAIGSVPLAAGLPCGQIMLSVAVLAIIVTAPLGAIGIDCTYKRLLTEDKPTKSHYTLNIVGHFHSLCIYFLAHNLLYC